MNINSKIDWKGGMEITPQTFIEFDKNIDQRQEAANKITNGGLFGIIPYSEFQCDAVFVRKTLEISRLQLMALLPSGKILHIDEAVSVPISVMYGDTFYFTAKFGEEIVNFDEKTIPFVKQEIVYNISTLEEAKKNDAFPLLKFYLKDGVFTRDESYIPPCIQLGGNKNWEDTLHSFSEALKALSEHSNLESGEAKRTFLRFAFRLLKYNLNNRTKDFISLMGEISQAIEYYIVLPNVEKPQPIEYADEYDISIWLKWFAEYLKGASAILDKVVLEDHTIDLEKMKAEVEVDLYNRIYPVIYANVSEEMEVELREALTQEITEKITNYIDFDLRDKLYRQLYDELHTTIYKRVYDELYDALYQALYVPEHEVVEDTFVPLI